MVNWNKTTVRGNKKYHEEEDCRVMIEYLYKEDDYRVARAPGPTKSQLATILCVCVCASLTYLHYLHSWGCGHFVWELRKVYEVTTNHYFF